MGLAVCAIFKNEAPFLAEWVTFHRLLGVEQFYLYDNGSTDDWRAVLRPEIEAGVVEVTDWPAKAAQLEAYQHCLEHKRKRPRWIAFIDIDEFLFSPDGRTLPKALAGFSHQPGVVAGWRVYGTGGHNEPPEGLVTESYLTRAPEDHFLNTYGKSIVDPRQTVSYVMSPHYFRHYHPRKPWRFVPPVDAARGPYTEPQFDESGEINPGQCSEADVLRINHYYTRSESEALAKWERGYVLRSGQPPLEQLLDPRLNEVRDDAILRFVPELKERLDQRPAAAK